MNIPITYFIKKSIIYLLSFIFSTQILVSSLSFQSTELSSFIAILKLNLQNSTNVFSDVQNVNLILEPQSSIYLSNETVQVCIGSLGDPFTPIIQSSKIFNNPRTLKDNRERSPYC